MPLRLSQQREKKRRRKKRKTIFFGVIIVIRFFVVVVVVVVSVGFLCFFFSFLLPLSLPSETLERRGYEAVISFILIDPHSALKRLQSVIPPPSPSPRLIPPR